jgi:competence protein ComEC
MNNGTRKGGEPDAFRVLYDSPGLEDLWQLHWSYNVGLENTPATFIANVDDNATVANVLSAAQAAGPRGGGGAAAAHSPAYLIKVSAQQDGSFTVTNTRNGFSKTYKPKP